MPELTDLSVIRALCEKYDFALSKGFGQNFIINPGLPPKIVDASGVDRRYGVIEIGPGIGVLTRELAKRAAKVVSIEVDERLPPLLAETMAGVDNFKLVLQDVLKVDLKALIAEEFPGMPVAVCANLPYYITSPIVMKLLGDRLPIESLTVMVQKEAADRLAAVPGTRASSAISCAVSYYATSKMMFTAAPGSFYPAPKVTSAVVRMEIRPQPAVQVEDEEGYFALVRAAFGQRRKTAANAIASGLGMPKDAVTAAIEAAGFDARIRPEALTLEDFAKDSAGSCPLTPPTSRPFQGEACLLCDYRTTIHPDGGFCLRIFQEFREPRRIKRNPERGSQRLRRALGGTRILLAAAPTEPPCFCHWQRSSRPVLKKCLQNRKSSTRFGYWISWWARVDIASRAAKNSPLGCFCAVFSDVAAAVRIHP